MNSDKTLKLNSDFRRLYSKGKSAATDYLVIYCLKNRYGLSRVGYTVSTKLGHAVVRNRVRRRLREIYRLNSPISGYDMVIVARSKSVTGTYQEIETAYLSALCQLGILA